MRVEFLLKTELVSLFFHLINRFFSRVREPPGRLEIQMMKREEEIRSDEPTDQTMVGTVEREAVHLNFEDEYSPTPLTVRLRRCVLSRMCSFACCEWEADMVHERVRKKKTMFWPFCMHSYVRVSFDECDSCVGVCVRVSVCV